MRVLCSRVPFPSRPSQLEKGVLPLAPVPTLLIQSHSTQIMPHPNRSVHNREEDDRMDDRPQVLRNNMVLEASGQAAAAATALSSTLAEYDRVAGVAAGPGAGGGGGRVNIALAAANAAAAAAAAGGPSVAGAAAGAQRVSPEADGAVAAVQPQEVADRGAGAVAVNGTGDSGAGAGNGTDPPGVVSTMQPPQGPPPVRQQQPNADPVIGPAASARAAAAAPGAGPAARPSARFTISPVGSECGRLRQPAPIVVVGSLALLALNAPQARSCYTRTRLARPP